MKLLMLKGLPASGKSTYARELVKDGWVRTNKDELREIMHGGKWSGGNEKAVIAIRDAIIADALGRGRSVVVDDTNFHPSHEQRLREIAQTFQAAFEIKEFVIDVDTCIERDLKRPNSVGERVIRRMWRESVAPVQERLVGEGPKAVIFDIDGTLARMHARNPFDWAKVGNDLLNGEVAQLLALFREGGYSILVFSGRDAVCRSQTEEWLEVHHVRYEELHMRPEGDNRKDVEIKREMYGRLCDRYDIRYAVDDRPQVCRLWHELGLCLLKVGDPDLEF